MTPLEATRRLALVDFADPDTGCCIACDALPDAMDGDILAHTSACPIDALPMICAALEAAEAYLAPGSEGGGSFDRLQMLEDILKRNV